MSKSCLDGDGEEEVMGREWSKSEKQVERKPTEKDKTLMQHIHMFTHSHIKHYVFFAT